jgi:DNA-binding CsgD family transcriptional regulator
MGWDKIRKIFRRFEKLPQVGFVFFGCGLARAWLWYTLDLVTYSQSFSSFSPNASHLVFDIGEIIGFFLLAGSARWLAPYLRRVTVLFAAVVLMMVCYIGTVFCHPASIGIGAEVTLMLIGGFGYAIFLLLWLELFGFLSSRTMLVAWTGSFFVGIAVWLIQLNSNESFANCLTLVLPIISAYMLLKAFSNIADNVNLSTAIKRIELPWKLLVVLAAFALSFGLGDVLAGQAMFAESSKIGMGIPELAVLVGALCFSRYFNIKLMVNAAVLFITVGLLISFLAESYSTASFILVLAGSEVYLILAYAIGCSLSHQLNVSSTVLCGLFAGLYKVFLQLGKLLGHSIMSETFNLTIDDVVVKITVVALAVITSIIFIQDNRILDAFSLRRRVVAIQRTETAELAANYRLSPKETEIFLLLADGLDSNEIANALFLAPSTIRAHISSIYKKLGIHSKKELRALMRSGEQQKNARKA